MTSPPGHTNDHISDAELAAYMDRNVAPAERDRVESHLADCDECRRHLIETRKVLGGIDRTRSLRLVATLAAAAAVLVFVRSEVWTTRQSTTAFSLVAGPAPRKSRHTRSKRGRQPKRSRIRLESGVRRGLVPDHSESRRRTPLWSKTTTDTVAILPPSVVLQNGQKHLWVTDALLLDGTTRSTGLREFRVTSEAAPGPHFWRGIHNAVVQC